MHHTGIHSCYYHPQRRLCFYMCLSVILFTGGAIPACIAGGIPACLAAGVVLFQHAFQVVSQHALQWGVPAPGGYLLQRGVPAPGGSAPEEVPAPGRSLVQGGMPAPGRAHTTRKQTATVEDGTHPTGMHSCCQVDWVSLTMTKKLQNKTVFQ